MSLIRTTTFKDEIRRIREGVSRLIHDEPEAGGNAWRSPPQPDFTIRDVMLADLHTVRPEMLLGPAVALMIEKQVSSLPVVDGDGRVVGALNQKDLLKVFYDPEVTTVACVMTTDPIVMPIHTPLIEVIDELMASDFRRVLIQEDGRLVGVIVRTHLMPVVLVKIEEVATTREALRKPSH